MSLLTVKNLTKTFGGVRAVDDLHFTVKENSITGLIGPNGAGKTTAFNLITHFLPKDRGTVHFDKHNISKDRIYRTVRKGCARTFQQIRLFPTLTVRENLLLAHSHTHDKWWKSFGKKEEHTANKRLESLLKSIKTKGSTDLTTFLDQKAEDLSYGQKKIISILRTVLTDANLILLDEPASGINPTMLGIIENLILQLKKEGKTILVIEHNMPFLMKLSDEIIVMENGRFLCQDVPRKVQENERVLEAYLGA